jgi:hypothetical protein
MGAGRSQRRKNTGTTRWKDLGKSNLTRDNSTTARLNLTGLYRDAASAPQDAGDLVANAIVVLDKHRAYSGSRATDRGTPQILEASLPSDFPVCKRRDWAEPDLHDPDFLNDRRASTRQTSFVWITRAILPENLIRVGRSLKKLDRRSDGSWEHRSSEMAALARPSVPA